MAEGGTRGTVGQRLLGAHVLTHLVGGVVAGILNVISRVAMEMRRGCWEIQQLTLKSEKGVLTACLWYS